MRKRRLAEKQALVRMLIMILIYCSTVIENLHLLYFQFASIDEQGSFNPSKKIVLDYDPKTKEELVTVNARLAEKLKSHQIEGVMFMWDATFESVQKLQKSRGGGCILAHCMGLGKTFQVNRCLNISQGKYEVYTSYQRTISLE